MKGRFLFALLAAAAFVPAAASAQQTYSKSNPPYDLWCRDVRDGSIGGHQICSAYTYEQCMASRYSPGERCYLNPRYDPRFQRR
jgi:hypothetical protein